MSFYDLKPTSYGLFEGAGPSFVSKKCCWFVNHHQVLQALHVSGFTQLANQFVQKPVKLSCERAFVNKHTAPCCPHAPADQIPCLHSMVLGFAATQKNKWINIKIYEDNFGQKHRCMVDFDDKRVR